MGPESFERHHDCRCSMSPFVDTYSDAAGAAVVAEAERITREAVTS